MSGLALTLAWPRRILFAECDPAGGQVLSGYLVGQPRGRGLAEWAVQLRRGVDPQQALRTQILLLSDVESRAVLAGLAEPAQLSSVEPLWPSVAQTFAGISDDVIVDLGRVGGSDTALPILNRADQVLMVTRPNLPELAAAAPRLKKIKELRGPLPGPRILLTGRGPYSRKEVARTLDTEVAAHLPYDPRVAAVLSHGTGNPRNIGRSLLIRAARSVAGGLLAYAERDEVPTP
ncbi:P-loop NTPase family protein [Spongiactinospora rosea]|uniref:hypothetical protein n=1 Tax=Spongiactinospora rosea TaxID=2248750 RepID=UPI0011C06F99|nr:hypothetical protein [Spongiactinospora rosea]